MTKVFDFKAGSGENTHVLMLALSADPTFVDQLGRLPQVAEIVEVGHVEFVLRRNTLFDSDELIAAVVPLIEGLAIRTTQPELYAPHYKVDPPDMRDGSFRIWLQGPADKQLLNDLENDAGIKTVSDHPRDYCIYIVYHMGYKKGEVLARVNVYCTNYLTRQK